MFRRRWTRVACGALVAAAGCMPPSLVRFEPTSSDTEWRNGHAVSHSEQDGVHTWVSYERATESFVMFDLAVRNESDAAIVVSPEACTIDYGAGPRPAFDPERELRAVEHAEIVTGAGHADPYREVLDGRRHLWGDLALRRTTLRPGEEIRGFVHFPRPPEPREASRAWARTERPQELVGKTERAVVRCVAGPYAFPYDFALQWEPAY